MALTVPAMSTVPKGTYVDVSITVHGTREGFRWKAPGDMSAEQALAEIDRDLLRPFLDRFLITPPKEA